MAPLALHRFLSLCVCLVTWCGDGVVMHHALWKRKITGGIEIDQTISWTHGPSPYAGDKAACTAGMACEGAFRCHPPSVLSYYAGLIKISGCC
jgi:hypothetical protein